MSSILRTLSLFCLVILPSCSALQVTPGSPCAEACLDNPKDDPNDPGSSNTNTTDISCKDKDYLTTGIGTKYKSCQLCLMTSESVDESTNESDVTWFLYNLRYTVDVCLYGFGNSSEKESSPCDIDTSCLPLKGALLDGDLDPEAAQYGYCDAENGAFNWANIKSCVSCLGADSSQKYLANFITALQAGCKQQPEPGAILSFEGELFSATSINITEPIPLNDEEDPTGLSVGAIVGIAVGAALFFIGGTALLIVYWRRQRAEEKEREKSHPGSAPPRSAAGSYNSYAAGDHSYGADHKKSSSFNSEVEMRPGGFPGHGHERTGSFTSNAEYYDKLEEAMGGSAMGHAPRSKKTCQGTVLRSGSALPSHHAYVPRGGMSRSTTPSPIPPPSQASFRAPSRTKMTTVAAPPQMATTTPSSHPPTPPSAPSALGAHPPRTSPTPPPMATGSTTVSRSGTKSKKAHRPSPLQNIPPQTQSSYTLQKYLTDANDIPMPPPPPGPGAHVHPPVSNGAITGGPLSGHPTTGGPMTGRSVLSQESQKTQQSNRSTYSEGAARGTMTSQGPGTSGLSLSPPTTLPGPPPGPPPAAKLSGSSSGLSRLSPRSVLSGGVGIPNLHLPSVPRIKVPKKYSPPKIFVQGSTPVEAHEISGPLDPGNHVITEGTMGSRFPDTSFGDNAAGQGVVERSVVLPSWRRHEAEEVQTGKSAQLYG